MTRITVASLLVILILSPAVAWADDAPPRRPYMDLRIELHADRSVSGRCVLYVPTGRYAGLKSKNPNADALAQHFAKGATGRYDDARHAVVATVRKSGALVEVAERTLGFVMGDKQTLQRIERGKGGRYVLRFHQLDAQGRETSRAVVICPERAEKPVFVAERKAILFRMPLGSNATRNEAMDMLQKLLREKIQAGQATHKQAAQPVQPSGFQRQPQRDQAEQNRRAQAMQRAQQLQRYRQRQQAQRRAASGRNLIINGVRITGQQLALVQQLERRYGTRLPNGAYWYDAVSGLIGQRGGPSLGKIVSGLRLGDRLRADASGGRTSVFVNGRALHPVEIRRLRQLLGVVYPGQWWVTSNGNYGLMGRGTMGNLYRAGGSGSRRSESLLSGSFLTGVSVYPGG